MHWRHEQLSLRIALATTNAPQRAAQGKGGVEGETNDAPRRPKPPLLGKWPAPLEKVPQEMLVQHSGIHYELVLALVVPVLRMVEQPVDASALSFFEEAEAKDLEVEYLELARTASHDSRPWSSGRGRKKKKKWKKRKLPKCSSPRSLPARTVRTRKSGHLSCGSSWCSVSGCCLSSPRSFNFWEMASTVFLYSTLCLVRWWIHAHASVCVAFGRFLWFFHGPLYLAVACSTLFVLEEYSYSIFWEVTSGYVVFSASWFDSGYIFPLVYGLCGYCFRIQRNAWISVVHAVRQSRSLRFSTRRHDYHHGQCDHATNSSARDDRASDG